MDRVGDQGNGTERQAVAHVGRMPQLRRKIIGERSRRLRRLDRQAVDFRQRAQVHVAGNEEVA